MRIKRKTARVKRPERVSKVIISYAELMSVPEKPMFSRQPMRQCIVKSTAPWTSTQFAVSAFTDMLPRMGKITEIIGTVDERRKYLVGFNSISGCAFIFDGFAWWYRGEGPAGLVKCLRKLGVPAQILEKLNSYDAVYHGPHQKPNSFVINFKIPARSTIQEGD